MKDLFGATGKFSDESVDAIKIVGYEFKVSNEAIESVGKAVNKTIKAVTTDEKDKSCR